MSMGTITGASSVHWAEPEVMSRFITATITTMPANVNTGLRPSEPMKSAPCTASTGPIPDHWKYAVNCAAAKNSTSTGVTPARPLAMASGTSRAVVMVPAARP